MNRCLTAALAVAGLTALGTLPSCNTPSCGAGTKQVQAADGTLHCEPTESPATWENVVVGKAKEIVGRALHDEELEEEGEEQEEIAHEVHDEENHSS